MFVEQTFDECAVSLYASFTWWRVEYRCRQMPAMTDPRRINMSNDLSNKTERTISVRDLDALLEALLGVLGTVKSALWHDSAVRADNLPTETMQRRANSAFGKKGGAQMSEIESVSIPASICQPLDFLFPDSMSAQSVLLTPVHVGMPYSATPYEGLRIATWTDGPTTEYTDILTDTTVRESGEDVFEFVGVIDISKTDIPGLTIDQQVKSLKALVAETCKMAGIDRRPNGSDLDDDSMDALDAEIAATLGTAG